MYSKQNYGNNKNGSGEFEDMYPKSVFISNGNA
jgi:hypothetical protein